MATWFGEHWIKIGSILGAVILLCGLGAVLAVLMLGSLAFGAWQWGGSRFEGPGRQAIVLGQGGRGGPDGMRQDRFTDPSLLRDDQRGEFGRPDFATRHFFAADAHSGKGLTGAVIDLEANSFTVEITGGDELTVNVTDDTRVWLVESESEGDFSDLSTGSTVVVLGRTSDETIDARGLVVMPAGERGGGRVTAIDGDKITVEDLNGAVTLVTTDETEFRSGKSEASLTDLEPGEFVIAFGDKQKDGTLEARLVFVGQHGLGSIWPGTGF
ncbi:MAG TPA: DUF5666 domain-containing protein [Anaerolineae bacterium]|nr:DUF5666 domain-containing protein [Anaerolineae bacterium]